MRITLDIRTGDDEVRVDKVIDVSPNHPAPAETQANDTDEAATQPAAAAPIELWQGISREESENSYIRQWGVYTAYDVGDRMPPISWAGCNGACAFVDAEGNMRVVGSGARATIPREMGMLLRSSPPFSMFATTKNIAALVPFEVDGSPSNRLIVWGEPVVNAGVTHRLGGIRHVYAGSQSLVLIYDKPVGGLWLDVIGGLETNAVPASVQLGLAGDPPVSVHVTENAFAVLTSAGKVWAWGDAAQGGAIPAATAEQLARMTIRKIVSSQMAFCAIASDGQLVAWGDATSGGVLPATALDTILGDGGALSVVANRTAFTCITRGRRKAVAWGDATNGGTISDTAAILASTGNIVACKATADAFCIVASDGNFAAWGMAAAGGMPPAAAGIASTEDTPSTDLATEADLPEVTSSLKSLFSAASYNAASTDWVGASCTTSQGRVELHATEAGFLMVVTAADGHITALHAWGSYTQPEDPTRQVLLSSRPSQIVTCNRGCLAIVSQGDVDGRAIVWGDPTATSILTSPLVDFLDSSIVEVHPLIWTLDAGNATSSSFGFVCRNSDGVAAIWGSGIEPALIPAPA